MLLTDNLCRLSVLNNFITQQLARISQSLTREIDQKHLVSVQSGVRATWSGAPDCDTCSSGLCWRTTTSTGASGRSSPRDPAFLLLESETYTCSFKITADPFAASYISWSPHNIPFQATQRTLSCPRLEGRRPGNRGPPAPRGEPGVCLCSVFYSCLTVTLWIQIWDRHGLSKCLNLTALNKHGRVYDDSKMRLSLEPSHLSILCLLIWKCWCVFSPVWLPVMVRVWT